MFDSWCLLIMHSCKLATSHNSFRGEGGKGMRWKSNNNTNLNRAIQWLQFTYAKFPLFRCGWGRLLYPTQGPHCLRSTPSSASTGEERWAGEWDWTPFCSSGRKGCAHDQTEIQCWKQHLRAGGWGAQQVEHEAPICIILFPVASLTNECHKYWAVQRNKSSPLLGSAVCLISVLYGLHKYMLTQSAVPACESCTVWCVRTEAVS